MEAYAEFHGSWNAWHGSYRWQSLWQAAVDLGISNDHAHTALADCQTTLEVCRRMLLARKAD